MISLLENGQSQPSLPVENYTDEDHLVSLIYRFASKKDEWFNLLLSLSNCLSVSDKFPENHPYKDLSNRLLEHLKTALKISSQLHTSSKHLNSKSVLNHIPMGAMIIDLNGRIVEINELAENIISKTKSLSINQGFLIESDEKEIKQTLQALIDNQHTFSDALKLEHKDLKQASKLSKIVNSKSARTDFKLHITAIPSSEETSISQHFYLCFQTNNDNLIRTEDLKQHYQLTETEALVVKTLVNELSSQKVANKLKLKEATVRGHLTNIYTKLGVNRKPELIRKVLLQSLVSKPESANTIVPVNENIKQQTNLSFCIYLRDGRKLSYLDHKPVKHLSDSGSPQEEESILLLHNLMGSGFELPPGTEDLFVDNNIRIIIPERPGYGDSDPHPGRNHKDWCNDIIELLDTLKINKVKVVAHSIGGVYAMAMAEFIPQRVSKIAMVNAMPRIQDITNNDQPTPVLVTALIRSLKYAPFLIEPILRMAVGKDIEHFYEQQLSYIRPTREGRAADINLLKTSSYRHYSINNLKQSAKQGIRIWADELRLSFADLGFSLKNKEIEYHFWHGEHDDVIPAAAAANLAKDVNTTFFKRIDTETHFLFARQFNEIISTLIKA